MEVLWTKSGLIMCFNKTIGRNCDLVGLRLIECMGTNGDDRNNLSLLQLHRCRYPKGCQSPRGQGNATRTHHKSEAGEYLRMYH